MSFCARAHTHTHLCASSERTERDNDSDRLIARRFQSGCTCHVKPLSLSPCSPAKSVETHGRPIETSRAASSRITLRTAHIRESMICSQRQHTLAPTVPLSLSLPVFHKIDHCTSQTKNVSKLHGLSFHFRPLPSLFHSSRQCSSSPFSYLKEDGK